MIVQHHQLQLHKCVSLCFDVLELAPFQITNWQTAFKIYNALQRCFLCAIAGVHHYFGLSSSMTLECLLDCM